MGRGIGRVSRHHIFNRADIQYRDIDYDFAGDGGGGSGGRISSLTAHVTRDSFRIVRVYVARGNAAECHCVR